MAAKIPEHILKDAIVLKFGTLSKLAKKMGLSKAYVSRGIALQNSGFITNLEKAGLKMKDVYSMVDAERSDELDKIASLESRILELEKLIQEKDKIIVHQNTLLDKYKQMFDKK
ncbi:MAG: hypothetical protein KGZ85_17200 [Ignavibacterium sp.]|nr:hypothetical protein [Ignavibacterium sp.]